MFEGMTHYVPRDEGWMFVFGLGECEHCTGNLIEANPLQMIIPERELLNLGISKWVGPLPDEIDVLNDGTCVCSQCAAMMRAAGPVEDGRVPPETNLTRAISLLNQAVWLLEEEERASE